MKLPYHPPLLKRSVSALLATMLFFTFASITLAQWPPRIVENGPWTQVGMAGFSAGQAPYISLAIDSSGTPYVAYADGAHSNKASVMKFDANNNTWVQVGAAGFSAGSATYTSLAIDSSGTPYVAYADGAHGNTASVMKFDANNNTWVQVGAAGFSPWTAWDTSLAIDSSGTPYLAYTDGANGGKASVMKFDAGSGNWVQVGTAGFSAGLAYNTSLAIDSSGTPYLAYTDGDNSYKASVMTFDGTNWVPVGAAGFSAGSAQYTSLAIDSSGTPYVAYRDGGNSGKASVMTFDGTNWVQVGSAGFSAGWAQYTSLAIDSSGTPYVAYRDYGNSDKASVMKYPSGDLTQTNVTLDEDGNPTPFSLTLNATDPDGDTITWSVSGNPAHGSALASGTGITQTIHYTPTANYNGTDSFVVQVSDGALTDTATVSVTINAVNDAPVAVDDTPSTAEDTPVTISPLGNDTNVDGDTLSVTSIGTSVHGTATISGTTQVVYTPTLNYNGTDSFSYIVSDGTFTDTAIVSVTISAVNDAPRMVENGPWIQVGMAGFSAGQATYTSLAIDSSGMPYVAYGDYHYYNGTKASVMKFDGTNWVQVGTAGFSAGPASGTSLAIDSSGTPYVAYRDYGNSDKASVMKFDGSNWVPVGAAGFSGGGKLHYSKTKGSIKFPK